MSGPKAVESTKSIERAVAVQAAQDQGLATARHIEGGMSAWTKARSDA
jgi:rhodanese-related sulfurtransferase